LRHNQKKAKKYYSGFSSFLLLFFHQRQAINPTMAKGAPIKYMIAVFSAAAGFSPSCEAVLVQMEHWAAEKE
jgi:hypothetical protein